MHACQCSYNFLYSDLYSAETRTLEQCCLLSGLVFPFQLRDRMGFLLAVKVPTVQTDLYNSWSLPLQFCYIVSSWQFKLTYKLTLSQFCEEYHQKQGWHCIESIGIFNNKAVFTGFILLTQEHEIFCCLFVYFFFNLLASSSSVSVLKSLLQGSFTTFVRLIPRHFIF